MEQEIIPIGPLGFYEPSSEEELAALVAHAYRNGCRCAPAARRTPSRAPSTRTRAHPAGTTWSSSRRRPGPT
jgi:hypothetical protein